LILSLAELEAKVRSVIAAAGLAPALRSIELDPEDDADVPFVRVNLMLHRVDSMRPDDLIALQEAIEDSVAEVDNRFASVRFAEAA
jgi:hypothetical protein